MAPLWLKAVVWSADLHPDRDVFFGAQVVESGTERGLGPDPALAIAPFDRRRLQGGNYIDQGAIAHRRGLPEAHYDESLTSSVDWDLILRLTAERQAVMIPVVAGSYSTTAPDRLTGTAESERSWEIVHARARDMAPLRVLAYNKMYPLVSERYIGEDLDSLAAQGAEIACCVYDRRSAPMPISYPLYTDLQHAVEQHRPEVALVHWTGVAFEQSEKLRALGIPYAVRAHSFAHEPAGIQRLLTDPWCVGIWCFPHHVIDDPRVHPLPTVFPAWEQLPPPAAARDLVLSVSAGLPKKDFPLLVDALAALPGIERRIVVGTTYSFESIVGDLVLMTQDLDDPPLVQANLDRETIFGLLARTSVFVYTLTAESAFGMPMSIVEAMTAGACVVAPDRPEVARAFGPDIRSYTTPDDIAAHVRAVVAGGPGIEAERERNRAWAIERYCDPETGKRFYAELADAVRAWTPAG